ncbi:Rrf2 family transcriptional regulator, partial [candidate division KSB1 bacterium]|nr:Rrf2 family transcriptional regulator [candidate division KSB1 bacterium]NIR72026.1 Rrf2 family transcriptional regulator [candidate division KSB1 bacterium]NIS26563.1 Rrf2 family transcriptional regulator [candidate division KSB1 bacterium]NIT73325.1 Rrf2 family transcriptional regulator [candidate division KSB1 bacterium]NIU27173.1 Rrf2 family transcriptional regulator [candidate division KSB1 bacterium]
TSDRIAWSVNTNPVVVRRVLGQLRKAGLVSSLPGASGGSKLKQEPEEITLADVFDAVRNGDDQFNSHSPNPECPVRSNILPTLEEVFDKTQAAMKVQLKKVT